ncbi:division/cell wall cluster transcriptional repressor MraZ [Polycladidibacter stylochi]|uniref:division/cell wall cluster transcriptional repressor MraZ n=1 Tax=Polycladidibacter stylochi TaxID=1807766 RepID=UPI00083107D7|nr:cell division protein MraZ [Pseudovibrio stylochi]
MAGFVSHYTNKVDAKGRVSIPAAFRSVLAQDGFDGLYCFPSPFQPAIDAGGNKLLDEISKRLEGFTPLTVEHDALSTAFFGASETFGIDRDGRIQLSETLQNHTGIDRRVVFVGQGFKFQIWAPEAFAKHQDEAKKRALAVLRCQNNNREMPEMHNGN